MFEDLATQDSQDPAGFLCVDPAVDPTGFTTPDPVVDPAMDPVGFLAAATEAMAKLPANLWRTGNEGFAEIAAGMDALAVQLDCTRVALVQEAESRGVIDQSPAPSAAAWLLEHSRHLEPGDASRTAKLAHLCALPKNQVMAAAVAGGTVTVRKAMTALRQLHEVEHDLAPGGREQALGWLTQMAQTGHNQHVIAVGRALMALAGADRALEHDEDKLRTLNSLRMWPLENGMTAHSGRLDPESAAVLSAALDPLSAPNPCSENGGRDPRPADRRRAEALIEVCRRAAAAGGDAPATSKAQLVVLTDLDRLTDAVRGYGTTAAGEVLSAQTIRKIACDASIIPMVLGSQSQPWTWGEPIPRKREVPPDWSPRLCWSRCGSGTKAAPSQAAEDHLFGAPRITSDIGSMVEPPACSIPRCSARPTTPTSTSMTSPPPSPNTTSPGTPDRSDRPSPTGQLGVGEPNGRPVDAPNGRSGRHS